MLQISPEKRRWLIVAIIFFAIVLSYVDRQILSLLKPLLKGEFGFDDVGYATLVNIFTSLYAVMYVVSGWLVDRFGVRVLMLSGIVTWSLACIGAGLTRSFSALATMRGLLGFSEPTAFPSQIRVMAIWFPGRIRATANSVCLAGGTIGALIAPPLVSWIALNHHWRDAFIWPGAAGLVVAGLWYLIYRDPPAKIQEEAKVTSVTDHDAKFTWPQLWRTRSLWAVLLIRFISDPVWYFCLFWLPGYLQEGMGLTLAQVGMVGWIPFLAADLGAVSSAAWSDRMVKNGVVPLKARKIMLTRVAFVAPLCALVPYLGSPAWTLIIFSLVAACCFSWLLSLCVVIAEAFPARNVASVLGIAGGCGCCGAIIFNSYVGQMLASIGSYRVFAIMACLHPIAAVILWKVVRPERPPESSRSVGEIPSQK